MMGHDGSSSRPLVRTENWRATVHILLNRPNSSQNAMILQLGTIGLILLSTLFFVLESLPDAQTDAWDVLDALIAVIFTIELVLRFVVAPDGRGEEEDEPANTSLTPKQARLRLLRQPLVIVDICAVAPFWFGLIFSGIAPGASLVFRALRLVRILRLLRLTQASQEMHHFVDCVQRCAVALRLLLFLLLLQILILGGLVFHLERGSSVVGGMWCDDSVSSAADGDDGLPVVCGRPSTFQSIPEAAWWCLVTVTTVGYGDLVPSTVIGKLVASSAMLTGLLLMAAIISIVGNEMNDLRRAAAINLPNLPVEMSGAFSSRARTQPANGHTRTPSGGGGLVGAPPLDASAGAAGANGTAGLAPLSAAHGVAGDGLRTQVELLSKQLEQVQQQQAALIELLQAQTAGVGPLLQAQGGSLTPARRARVDPTSEAGAQEAV